MPLDAVLLSALRAELEVQISGAKIDKIFQPERDELVLSLRGRGGSFKLLFSASPNHARLHLSTEPKENPAVPPMFCMLMRKHLSGAVIAGIRQPPLERMLEIELQTVDEMGMDARKCLVMELIGRQSNLILLDRDGRIIDSLRRIDNDLSSARSVLPGMFYKAPPPLEKVNLLTLSHESLCALVGQASGEKHLDEWILDTFFGISPLIARELASTIRGDGSLRFAEISPAEREMLADALEQLFSQIKGSGQEPYMIYRGDEPFDISYRPIFQYGEQYRSERFASFSQLIEQFYLKRDRTQRIRQRTQQTTKMINSALERLRRKTETQKREIAEAKNRDRLREYGDLLMANLHRISGGQTAAEVEDFYSADGGPVLIRLDPRLSAQQNAAKYYKDYNRMKHAERILAEQIATGEQEILYLQSVLDELLRAETDRDIQEIREELQNTGYIRPDPATRKKTPALRPPRTFVTSGGFPVFVGRNNLQNDRLTFKDAHRNDLWFHVKGFHGSHVLLRCGEKEPDDASYSEAAMLAALFSEARDGQKVPVDYTRVRYVKKPAGARPGMVIYDPYFTAYATPDPRLAEQLGQG